MIQQTLVKCVASFSLWAPHPCFVLHKLCGTINQQRRQSFWPSYKKKKKKKKNTLRRLCLCSQNKDLNGKLSIGVPRVNTLCCLMSDILSHGQHWNDLYLRNNIFLDVHHIKLSCKHSCKKKLPLLQESPVYSRFWCNSQWETSSHTQKIWWMNWNNF